MYDWVGVVGVKYVSRNSHIISFETLPKPQALSLLSCTDALFFLFSLPSPFNGRLCLLFPLQENPDSERRNCESFICIWCPQEFFELFGGFDWWVFVFLVKFSSAEVCFWDCVLGFLFDYWVCVFLLGFHVLKLGFEVFLVYFCWFWLLGFYFFPGGVIGVGVELKWFFLIGF